MLQQDLVDEKIKRAFNSTKQKQFTPLCVVVEDFPLRANRTWIQLRVWLQYRDRIKESEKKTTFNSGGKHN